MKNTNGIYIFKNAIALLIAGLMLAGFPAQSAHASSNLDEVRKQLETIAGGFHGKIGIII